MKAGGKFVIISLLWTVSQASKLLKVPRIYNAIITSDKELLPSQAFPALSPVLQSIHFPHYANTIYHQPINVESVPMMNTMNGNPELMVPMTNTLNGNTESMVSEPKEEPEPYQYNKPKNQISYDVKYPKSIPGIPMGEDNFLRSNPTPLVPTPVLFRPNLESKNEENMPNIIPNSNFNSDVANMKRPSYPHYDQEVGQIYNVMNYYNKKVYSASIPMSPNTNSPTTQKSASDIRLTFPYSQANSVPFQPNNDKLSDTQCNDGNQFLSNQDESAYVDPSTQLNANQDPFFSDLTKNNASKDKSIADVPPPPLPVGKPNSQTRNENPTANPLQLGIGF